MLLINFTICVINVMLLQTNNNIIRKKLGLLEMWQEGQKGAAR